ncbi:DUF1754-domain-containing protein [Conidiobolus coronatus NRRL 28638]|uniref:DUF1754-domain-containing protein n=1 Tax=Conidiobolus coronatus (strain ATCC 28846 / CBS 209.66 / NRRL 28638) TaxID=796925 RepID=A0A137P6F1_CONC2|nr:DUF1754-domain-containing protein [Conidiobolus coronatus NRRL 28638]|eukprot:KXN70582.1 DUF1754-domain-containing protein [Conidiobolus coronatus NRRL 28638]
MGKGSLSFKGEKGIKKKSKKSKLKVESVKDLKDDFTQVKTESELKFEKIQQERMKEKIKEVSKHSHKDKVAEFNAKLSNLSEHYDIPKVGPG